MSLRDFNTPISDDPLALHNTPLGNGSGLDSFHTVHPETIEPNNTPKILAGLVVALMVGVGGAALYASSSSHPKAVVADTTLPAAPAVPAPVQTAAVTPDANTAATPAPAASAPADVAPAPAAPVKSASIKRNATVASVAPSTSDAASARMAADSSQVTATQPQQQAVAIPEPVSPTPSPSDVATNNTQSGVAVSPNAVTAQDIPAQNVAPQDAASPQPAPATPDQQANAAPAQPSGQ